MGENNKKVKELVVNWISFSEYNQKEIAENLNMSSSGLNQMLKGTKDIDLPISRFLQLITLLRPSQEEITKAWNLYLEDLEITPKTLQLIFKPQSNISMHARVHDLVDQLNEQQLAPFEALMEVIIKNMEV